MPQTEWLKQHTFLPHSCDAVWKSKISALADLMSGENLLLGSQRAISSLCPHVAEAGRELSRVSFIRH